MPKPFAQKVREIMQIDLKGREEITYNDIAVRLDMISDKEKRPLYRTMRDFIKRGEVVRVRDGVLSYKGLERELRPADKTHCMFRLIRANRKYTLMVSDLVANCQVSEIMAKEYLRMMVRRGFMRRIDRPNNQPSHYKMIHDPGPNLVRNEENAEKMRRLRKKQKEVEAALTAVELAIKKGRAAIADMAVITKE